MTGFNYRSLVPPSLDHTHTGHIVSAKLQDILLILLLLVTFSVHPVSAEYHDIKGCQFSTQKGTSSEDQPFKGHVTRGYVINSLKLVKQISSQDCLPGTMYGYTLTTWWVKHGCIAKFKIEECLIAALSPTESTGENLEVDEHHKSNRKHFKFDADNITPGHYPNQTRKEVQRARSNVRKQQPPHEVEASGNINPFTVETKSNTTTASRKESNSSPTLLITTFLLVVAFGTHTLL